MFPEHFSNDVIKINVGYYKFCPIFTRRNPINKFFYVKTGIISDGF
jgi:hypothetical protein